MVLTRGLLVEPGLHRVSHSNSRFTIMNQKTVITSVSERLRSCRRIGALTRLGLRLLLLMVAVAATFTCSLGEAAESLRSWTPRDSVALRYFQTEVPIFSPDGSYFYFISWHGDVVTDKNIFEMSVYATSDIRQALKMPVDKRISPNPVGRVVRGVSDHGGPAFNDVRWTGGGIAIQYWGQDESGKEQVFVLDLKSGNVRTMTNWPLGLTGLKLGNPLPISPAVLGETVISNVIEAIVERPEPIYPIHVVQPGELVPSRVERTSSSVFVSYRDGEPWKAASRIISSHSTYAPEWLQPPELSSPDGHRLIGFALRRSLDGLPAIWSAYDRWASLWAGKLPAASYEVAQFVLIDAKRKFDRAVLDAPVGTATMVGYDCRASVPPAAWWSADERHVILSNAALPLEGPDCEERSRMAYLVGFDADTGEWAVIEPLQAKVPGGDEIQRVAQVGWLKKGMEFLVRHQIGERWVEGTVYRLVDGKWIGTSVPESVELPVQPDDIGSQLPDDFRIVLRQSANAAPMFVATDGKNEVVLTKPDQALQSLKIHRQEEIVWRDPYGQVRKAGLLLPERKGGELPPLVIQAYDYIPEKFLPDGPERNGYAGQSLAARGMAVLNISFGKPFDPKIGTPLELTDFAAQVESAANVLASRGLIDPSKVGLIGFSRGGYNSLYAITHPGRTPISAAVLDDAYTGTYAGMISHREGYRWPAMTEYGGSFWDHKSDWLLHEPSFNFDRVRTPVLYVSHHESQVPLVADLVNGFAANKRPLEYLVIPGGRHTLEMPLERLASLQATVDWMCFWLKGEIPSDPERAARWAVLRKQQDEVLKTPPPPKGKWIFVQDPIQPEWPIYGARGQAEDVRAKQKTAKQKTSGLDN